MYEPITWKKYKKCFSFKGKSVVIFPSGIVVNPNNYWLGCTPDAKIEYEGYCGIGESKCPYNYRNSDLMFVAKSTDFYLDIACGRKYAVKQNHEYCSQVQCQLALTGDSFTDFIVYTFKSLFVQRIYFDESFWESIVKTVGNNHFNYIVPKIG